MGRAVVHFEIVGRDQPVAERLLRPAPRRRTSPGVPGVTLGQFADPEGHVVGLLQAMP